jgi:anti-sigma factor RsiW
VVRPTDVLTCYLTRRRLGALVDGALDDGRAGLAASHVSGCHRCRREVEELRRVRALIRRRFARAVPPDWSGFWAGVAGGIEDHRVLAPIRRPRPVVGAVMARPRLALGSAMAAALLISAGAWQFWPASIPEAPVVIRSANTEMPRASLMVYSPPENDMAVVWVMAVEDD